MKERKRILTIFGGIITVLVGIFILIISGYVLVESIAGTDPLGILATFGLIIILQIVLFIVALGLSVALITIGAFEIRLGIYKNLEYSERTGLLIAYSIFEGILIVLFVTIAVILAEFEALSGSSFIVAVGLGVGFILKIIDHIIFKVYVKKGKIVLVQNPVVANPAQLNINLQKLNNINLSNDKKNKKQLVAEKTVEEEPAKKVVKKNQ